MFGHRNDQNLFAGEGKAQRLGRSPAQRCTNTKLHRAAFSVFGSSSEREIIPMQLPDSFSVASHPSGWLPGWTWLNARD